MTLWDNETLEPSNFGTIRLWDQGTLWPWDHVIWELGNLGPQDFGTMGLMKNWKLNHGALGQCQWNWSSGLWDWPLFPPVNACWYLFVPISHCLLLLAPVFQYVTFWQLPLLFVHVQFGKILVSLAFLGLIGPFRTILTSFGPIFAFV